MKENEKRADFAQLYTDAKKPEALVRLESIGDAPILIDGSNVVFESKRHGWRVLKTLIDCLRNNGVNYFLYFDANILYGVKDDSGVVFIKTQLMDKNHAVCCPAKTQADEYILIHAHKNQNHIISNDSYKDFAADYPWINAKREDGRRIHRFKVVCGALSLPDLHIWEKIDTDARSTAEVEKLRKDVKRHSLYISEQISASNAEKMKELHKAAKRGVAEAQYRLGLCYYVGKCGWRRVEDLEEAEKWLCMAADQGHVDAQRELSSVQCFLGVSVQDRDPAEAVKWYRKAAESGDCAAMHWLGCCYYNGEGVEKNPAAAIKWYLKAAVQGYGSAQRDLGLCYSKGEGVTQDMNEAEKWWRKWIEQGDGCARFTLERYSSEAEHGDAVAQYQMGMFYLDGKCVDSKSLWVADNPWLAAKWFRKAAEQGHAEAQYELGELYSGGFFSGEEVPR